MLSTATWTRGRALVVGHAQRSDLTTKSLSCAAPVRLRPRLARQGRPPPSLSHRTKRLAPPLSKPEALRWCGGLLL